MEQQEIIYRLQMMEQQMQQLQQQVQAVERGMGELESLNSGLDEISKSKGKEIFARIGNGIYARAKIISEELLVNVGEGNFVDKSVEETKKLIQEQVKKLEDVKKELEENISATNSELMKLIGQYQDSEKS